MNFMMKRLNSAIQSLLIWGRIKKSHKGIGADLMGFYTRECKQMTSSVMQVMYWCLMQKGVGNGEMSVDEAAMKKNRLSNNQLFDVSVCCDMKKFPSEFTEYSNSVKTLYAKIIRVDRLLFEGGVLEENPVLNLINKIENNS